MQEALTERIMFRLDAKTKKALEERAMAEHRRVSELVRLLVEREVSVTQSPAQRPGRN